MKRFIVFLSFLITASLGAQTILNPNQPLPLPVRPAPVYTYAAKFVCGQAQQSAFVAAGTYLSTTNVHNPSRWASATLRKKFAIALPGEEVGKISPYFPKVLRADEAMQVDCRNIYGHIGLLPMTFIEGFIVIESSLELDVVTVYTAGSGTGGPGGLVTTMHTERVPARVGTACGDLFASVSTGGAAWNVVEENGVPVTPRPATVVTHPWGATMISAYPTGSGPSGSVTYETCFCLCTGVVKLNLQGLIADNVAQVYLNGVPIGPPIDSSVTAHWATAAELNAIMTGAAANFVAGQNCLRVKVTNKDNPSQTGFILNGVLAGANAACPR